MCAPPPRWFWCEPPALASTENDDADDADGRLTATERASTVGTKTTSTTTLARSPEREREEGALASSDSSQKEERERGEAEQWVGVNGEPGAARGIFREDVSARVAER
jgi:hypothetical protein